MSTFKRLSEPAWQALAEALRTYYWYKPEFQTLVRTYFSEAPSALAAVNFEATKRVATGELIAALRINERKYQSLVIDALVALGEFDPGFDHLARLDDGPTRIAEAKAAYVAVRNVTETYSELVESREAIRQEAAKEAAGVSARRLHDERLSELKDEFLELHNSSDKPQERGIAFESLLNRLFELWDLYPRGAYSLRHQQIDGAFTFRTDDYILEARWKKNPLQPKDLNDFKAKVNRKARNTLGLCISVLGFTDGAIEEHSHDQTPLILMDGTDLMPILEGRITLAEVLERKRRHAAETGNPMFRVSTLP